MYLGMLFIAVGAGIKPCVSANVGDQFGSRTSICFKGVPWPISINASAATAYHADPWKSRHGRLRARAHGIATWFGWGGTVRAYPAAAKFKEETLSPDGLCAVFNPPDFPSSS
jgi:hypothetical protein